MILTAISSISILIPTLFAIVTFRKQNKTLKKLSVFVFITAVLEGLGFYLVKSGWNNMFMFHFYSYIEVLFFGMIFFDLVKTKMRKLIILFAIVYLIFSLINISFWESLIEFNANQRYVGGIAIIGMSLLYFNKVFVDAKIEKIEKEYYFWFSSILLIYTAGTLFLFILGKEVHTEANGIYWNLHSVMNVVLNLGFTLTIWMGTRISR